MTAKVDMPGTPFFAVNAHLTAFAIDDTKQKHISGFKNILDDIVSSGYSFVAGGDLNAIPPNATKTNFCFEDQCSPGDYDPNDDKNAKNPRRIDSNVDQNVKNLNNGTNLDEKR